jgi:hypothetical protein
MANQIHVIKPYRHASTWVFDDPRVGLQKEPFVSGVPQMIDTLVANVPNAKEGFRLLFSAEPFPGYQVELAKVRAEYQGVWYRWVDRSRRLAVSSALSLLSNGTTAVICPH